MADRTMGFGGGGGEEPQAEMPASRSRWPRTLRNPSFVVGGTVILVILTLAIFAPLIAPFEPAKLGVGRRLLEPGWEYLLGTDQYGRDIFSRIIYGSRLISLCWFGRCRLRLRRGYRRRSHCGLYRWLGARSAHA